MNPTVYTLYNHHLHGVRSKPGYTMAQGLRRIDPLVFDENIAANWEKFNREWRVYSNAGLSNASKKVKAYTFLNLAGPVPCR